MIWIKHISSAHPLKKIPTTKKKQRAGDEVKGSGLKTKQQPPHLSPKNLHAHHLLISVFTWTTLCVSVQKCCLWPLCSHPTRLNHSSADEAGVSQSPSKHSLPLDLFSFLANSTQTPLWCSQVSWECEAHTLKSPRTDGFNWMHDWEQLLLITGLYRALIHHQIFQKAELEWNKWVWVSLGGATLALENVADVKKHS